MPICEAGYTLEDMKVCDPICHIEYQCVPDLYPIFVLKRAFTTIVVFLIVLFLMYASMLNNNPTQLILLLFVSIALFLNIVNLSSSE